MGGKEKINELKKKLTEAFEMPGEFALNQPLITVIGHKQMSIENFKSVIEYDDRRIRINTICGVLAISGKDMELKQITAENILIKGDIFKFEYIIN